MHDSFRYNNVYFWNISVTSKPRQSFTYSSTIQLFFSGQMSRYWVAEPAPRIFVEHGWVKVFIMYAGLAQL
jgi:hypothetical protein